MSEKWTPERAKAETETKILEVLARKSPLRWSELLSKTKISSKSLKKALDRMKNGGLIYREMETGNEYPPPVYYGLTPRAKKQIIPYIFAMDLSIDIFRPHVTPQLIRSDTEIEEALKDLGRKIGAIYLFAILKSLEYHDHDWWKKLHDYPIDFNLFELLIASRLKEPRILLTDEEVKELTPLDRDLLPKVYTLARDLKEKDIKKLQLLLKKSYPEIIEKIEDWIEEYEDEVRKYKKIMKLRGK